MQSTSTRNNLYGKRLDRQERHVRLLILRAGERPTDLHCSLSRFSLDERPCYDALSYVWGSAIDLVHINVNDSVFAVTQNLKTALQHLRHPTKDRLLWIDAICINQDDVEERNFQVGLMGAIYRSADYVLMWIGEGDTTSDAAFDMMAEVDVDFLQSTHASRLWSFYLDAIIRPYMSRVWVIQEFVLATRDPIVICGMKRVSWSVFMSAYKVLALEFFTNIDMARRIAEGNPPDLLAKTRYDLFDQLRNTVHQEGGADLRQLFWMSRLSECSEPRDRIYGLLQMLDQDDQDHFIVDYDRPTCEIFTQAMSLIFKQGDGPHFLGSMWCPSKPNPSVPGLPSWVPDFTAQSADKAAPFLFSVSFHPAFPRSVSGAGANADNGVVLSDLKTLKVEVLPVDVVEDVLCMGETVSDCLAQLDDIALLSQQAKSCLVRSDELCPFFERFRSSEPLWRTLVSNKKLNSGYDVAPPIYEEMYQRLRAAESNENVEFCYDYRRALESCLPRRTFFRTKSGLIGLGTAAARKDDEVTIWFGATVPFVVRRCESDAAKWTLIGASYVAGIMEGQMVDELYCEDLLDATTLLVV